MIRFRPLLALIAVASMLSFAVVDHADARAGGGFSFGSRGSRTFSPSISTPTAPGGGTPIQRSITQPSRPTFGQPAASGGGFFGRPGGFLGRPGFLGGMAAGFLGAGLLGMMFGHGLFGGLGGIASILGLILQVGLIVIVARLLWAWWQRRQAPAFAGPAARMANPEDYRGAYGGAAVPGATTPGLQGGVALTKDDFDAFERLLIETQDAYSREDLAALRDRVTPEMLAYFGEELAKSASRGLTNRISDVKLLQGDLSEAWHEGDVDYATVAMRYGLVDQMVDRNGRVAEGDDRPSEITELWTFLRSRGGHWLLSAIQQS
jgi:predicted lipid-binding transport protein (Tim44 family)